jgi:hypothetical protein
MRILSLIVVLVTPLLIWLWPPGANPEVNRFLMYEDVCPSEREPGCAYRKQQDSAIWGTQSTASYRNAPYVQVPMKSPGPANNRQ